LLPTKYFILYLRSVSSSFATLAVITLAVVIAIEKSNENLGNRKNSCDAIQQKINGLPMCCYIT
jgi:hypothetical protein